ncbi:MAG: hypothetical protein AAF871_12510 [Pseudomonadota bacterium]
MESAYHPAAIHLWSGDFASQQLAFAHLLDAADFSDAVIDMDAVEVIPAAKAALRLAPYLGTEINDLPDAPTLILLAAPPDQPPPFEHTALLRYAGCRSGRVLRAPGSAWT